MANIPHNRTTKGKCVPCGVVFSWQGPPELRHALCKLCGAPLMRTDKRITWPYVATRPAVSTEAHETKAGVA